MGQTVRKDAVIAAVAWSACLCAGLGAGCSTVSSPVLRHESGEALGEKHFRLSAHYETSRIFAPGAASDANVTNVPQGNSVFQGSFFGVQGEAGVLPKLDLQLGANFTLGGGGWRAGTKYELYRVGRIGIAGMVGFSSGSGSGNVTYLTTATPEDISLVLSAWTLDFSIPMSFRVSPWIQVYGAPMLLHSGVSGSYGGAVVSDVDNDWGLSLGLRIGSGMFFGDIEFAELLVNDPFVGGERFVPYGGVAFGVAF